MWEVRQFCAALLLIFAVNDVVLSLYVGDECYHQMKGASGECKLLEECENAVSDLKKRIFPERCGFIKDAAIVCCVESSMTTKPSTAEESSVSDKLPSSTPNSVTEVISMPSRDNKKRKDPGEKSRQKCKEYENLAFVEQPSPLLIPTNEMIKIKICPWDVEPIVFGGAQCKLGEFPHMALLKYGSSNKARCGGTLISENFVLTAAHCIITDEIRGPTTVRLGDLDITNPNDDTYVQEIKVKKVYKHPDYDEPKQYNDIALIQLEKPVVLSVYLKPACLYTEEDINFNKGIVTGWGITEDHVVSNHLLKASLDIFSKHRCSEKYNSIVSVFPKGIDYNIQICAGSYTSDKDTCGGDSGGPLQIYSTDVECSHYIFGVTSFGLRCGVVNSPAVYTKIYPYLEWIESIVWPS